jgi:signal transduction histidine kinase
VQSLFLRIFLTFWLTMILVGAGFELAWRLQPTEIIPRWQSVSADAISLFADTAAQITDTRGPAAARRFLDRVQQKSGIRAVLIGRGQPASAIAPSEDERRLVEQVFRSGHAALLIAHGRAVGAEPAAGPGGTAYVLLVELPPAGRNPLFPPWRQEIWRQLIAIAVSGLICYLLALSLTRPILRVQAAAESFSRGDLHARVAGTTVRQRDQLGALARDFNRMADRIETLFGSQQRLMRDISHELRSPLARLNVALELARQQAGETARESLDRIQLESERLNALIERLLTLARLQAAGAPPQPERISMRGLLQAIAADARFEAVARNVALQLDLSADCIVVASPELLRSAIENVARNAVQYTAAASVVEIGLECVGAAAPPFAASDAPSPPLFAVVRVRDHGPGLPEEELARIFMPFYRASGGRERETGGAGIGLAITQAAVTLHGGTVTARNARGGGLEVELRLPAYPAAENSNFTEAPGASAR